VGQGCDGSGNDVDEWVSVMSSVMTRELALQEERKRNEGFGGLSFYRNLPGKHEMELRMRPG